MPYIEDACCESKDSRMERAETIKQAVLSVQGDPYMAFELLFCPMCDTGHTILTKKKGEIVCEGCEEVFALSEARDLAVLLAKASIVDRDTTIMEANIYVEDLDF